MFIYTQREREGEGGSESEREREKDLNMCYAMHRLETVILEKEVVQILWQWESA